MPDSKIQLMAFYNQPDACVAEREGQRKTDQNRGENEMKMPSRCFVPKIDIKSDYLLFIIVTGM